MSVLYGKTQHNLSLLQRQLGGGSGTGQEVEKQARLRGKMEDIFNLRTGKGEGH